MSRGVSKKVFPIYQLIDLIFEMEDLSSSEKLLCIALLRFHNRKSGRCFPGLTRLSEATGMSRKTLIENTKKLEKKKVIKVKKGNRRKPNEYSLLFIWWLDIEPQSKPQIEPLSEPLSEPQPEPLTPPKQTKGKGNERKDIPPKSPKGGKSVKEFIPPKLEEVQSYFLENGYTKESGRKAWSYYDAGSWKDSQGRQVRCWKQKMRGVWFKDENKSDPEHDPKAGLEKFRRLDDSQLKIFAESGNILAFQVLKERGKAI